MANDIYSTIRSYLNKFTDGDSSASELSAALNQWVREGGEALKVKIEDEVERAVSKMGFVKRGEFEALMEEVARLNAAVNLNSIKKPSTKRVSTTSSTTKKSTGKKAGK